MDQAVPPSPSADCGYLSSGLDTFDGPYVVSNRRDLAGLGCGKQRTARIELLERGLDVLRAVDSVSACVAIGGGRVVRSGVAAVEAYGSGSTLFLRVGGEAAATSSVEQIRTLLEWE